MKSEALVLKLKELVATERKLASRILIYLKEVESRKLHLEMGYASLFDFCVKELGYSSSAASRRVSAMRVLKALPEVEQKIIDGSVNLSTLTQMQNFVRAEEKSANERMKVSKKEELLEMISNKSQREVEVELIKISPESVVPRFREKQVTEHLLEIRIVVSPKFREKLGRMRRLNSHRSVEITDVIERALDLAIEKLDPEGRSAKLREKTPAELQDELEEKEAGRVKYVAVDVTKENLMALHTYRGEKRSRYIRKEDIRRIHNRATGQCEFVSPKNGKRCEATLFLEIDHKIAWSKGGNNTHENLQLICGAHNKLKAEKEFGHLNCH